MNSEISWLHECKCDFVWLTSLNLRGARKPEIQSNDNILSLKFLGDVSATTDSFTLQNTGDWEKVLEFLFFPHYIFRNLSEGL